MNKIATLLLALLLAGCASAPPAAAPRQDTDEFRIETTVLAVYNVLSGPAGRRDWNRFEALFAPDGRLVFMTDKGPQTMTPKEYAAQAKPELDAHAWFAHPTSTQVLRSGTIAHVWSAYETRQASNQERPSSRGTQSFQMVRIGDEWKVQSLVRGPEAAAR